MPGAIDRDRISELLEPVVTGKGFDVEELTVVASGEENVITLMVDRDGGAGLDELATLSRSLSEVLDGDSDDDGGSGHEAVAALPTYTLEVTSPGIDRPLTAPRHWRRAAGRKVVIDLATEPAARVSGRIGPLNDDETTLTLVTKSGKGLSTQEVPLETVRVAHVQVDFSDPGAAELQMCGLDAEQIEARRKGNK
ncbi:ribosome maturation factor RimP [Williamsia limnetica]|uniref:Ribosome maturation factor RimP n=1 Tax=Williamsia limnetica TaxID=882452 RepID=A0A318RFY5_WILLI|nr:ribosome maturation factor RimP [Williamsia limnetica]PYE13299.1 ribosome maturation factor RimP [Williamsia limnetica]